MPNESLVIPFSLESISSSSGSACPDIVRQREEEEGYITKTDLVNALESKLFGGTFDPITCLLSPTTGGYVADIDMYSGDQYVEETGLTNGTLGVPVLERVETTEIIDFELTDSATTEYPIETLESTEWVGDVWDSEGSVVRVKPSISVEGDTITLSEKVYGSVEVKYTSLRYVRKATITPRTDSFGTALDSYVYAIKSCGVEIHKLNPPKNSETELSTGTDCNGYGGGLTDFTLNEDADEYDEVEASPEGIKINIDYCSQTRMY